MKKILFILIIGALLISGCSSYQDISYKDFCSSQCKGKSETFIKNGFLICQCIEDQEILSNCSMKYLRIV